MVGKLHFPYRRFIYLTVSKIFKVYILQNPSEPPVPKKPSFKQQQLRQREMALVAAAGHLLAAKGYERTTVDDVIGVVGISKPTFYSHFSGKEALAAKVIVSGLNTAFSRLEAFAATMPPGDAGALAFFDHEEVVAAETKLAERLAELINRGQQDGTIEKVVDARILSRTFRSILKDNSFFDATGDGKTAISEIKSGLKRLLLG
jgi:AcrR family transcriptional regulator